jgi:hypothetical protein
VLEKPKRVIVAATNVFKCHACDFTTSTLALLLSHKGLHPRAKTHKCDECGYAGVLAHHLKLHQERMHKGERKNIGGQSRGESVASDHEVPLGTNVSTGTKRHPSEDDTEEKVPPTSSAPPIRKPVATTTKTGAPRIKKRPSTASPTAIVVKKLVTQLSCVHQRLGEVLSSDALTLSAPPLPASSTAIYHLSEEVVQFLKPLLPTETKTPTATKTKKRKNKSGLGGQKKKKKKKKNDLVVEIIGADRLPLLRPSVWAEEFRDGQLDVWDGSPAFGNKTNLKLDQRVVAGESKLAGAGKGLFARRRLFKNEPLGPYGGYVCFDEESLAKFGGRGLRGAHSFDSYAVGCEWVRTDGAVPVVIGGMAPYGNATSLVNDGLYAPGVSYDELQVSDKVNVRGVLLMCRKRLALMWLVAARDIEEGEELFWKYGHRYWNYVAAASARQTTFDNVHTELCTLRSQTSSALLGLIASQPIKVL